MGLLHDYMFKKIQTIMADSSCVPRSRYSENIMQVSEEGCSISYRINSLRVWGRKGKGKYMSHEIIWLSKWSALVELTILILINMDHTVNHLEDMLKEQSIVGIPIEQKWKILKHCNKQNYLWLWFRHISERVGVRFWSTGVIYDFLLPWSNLFSIKIRVS